MDPQNQQPEQQPLDQNNPQSVIIAQPKHNWYKYGFWGVITVLLILFIVGFYIRTQSQSLFESKLLTEPTRFVTNIPSDQQTTTINTYKTFNDSRLEGMKFSYNPTIWNLRLFNYGDEEIKNEFKNAALGIIFREIEGGGKLYIYYTVALAQGGGISLFSNGDVVNLTDTFVRVRLQGEYLYGAQKNLTFFDKSPEDKNFLLKTCEEGPNPVIDDVDCSYVKSGQAIGYANQPAYSYSLKKKRNIPLKEFGFGEFESVTEDDEKLIVAISYQGKKPEAADEIIKQIVLDQ